MKNRAFSFVLGLLLFFIMPSFSVLAQNLQVCGDWDDVDSNVEEYEDMIEVCELNWIRGGGGKLNIDNKLKRIELVAVVNRVLGVTASDDGVKAYSDLSTRFNDLGEYDDAKNWMYRGLYAGVRQEANFNQSFWKGYPDGGFKMMNDISFAEFSKLILFAFERMDELNGNFRLSQFEGEEWYSSYFNFLESNGVLDYEGGEFQFNGVSYSVHDKMTRLDAIKFISKVLEKNIYKSGKVYEFNNISLEIPFYLDESDNFSESVRVWRDDSSDGVLTTVKILEDESLEVPSDFVSVYVPSRISDEVLRMYRIDRCNGSSMCIRAFWLVLNEGSLVLVEGSFDKEKTAQGEGAVSRIIDSILFN